MKDRIPLNTLSFVSSVCPSVCFGISFVLFVIIESNISRGHSWTETEARFVSVLDLFRVWIWMSISKPKWTWTRIMSQFPHLFVMHLLSPSGFLSCMFLCVRLINAEVHSHFGRIVAECLRYCTDSVIHKIFTKLAGMSSSVWKGVRESRKYKPPSLPRSPCYPSLLDTCCWISEWWTNIKEQAHGCNYFQIMTTEEDKE